MITGIVTQINPQGSVVYVQIQTVKGSDSTTAEAYIGAAASLSVIHAAIADACRQALALIDVAADADEPVRLFGAAQEIV